MSKAGRFVSPLYSSHLQKLIEMQLMCEIAHVKYNLKPARTGICREGNVVSSWIHCLYPNYQSILFTGSLALALGWYFSAYLHKSGSHTPSDQVYLMKLLKFKSKDIWSDGFWSWDRKDKLLQQNEEN